MKLIVKRIIFSIEKTLYYIGILLLIYVLHSFVLDGELYNKPIKFVNYDPLNIPLEKNSYHRGESVYSKPLSFCKDREVDSVESTWEFVGVDFYKVLEKQTSPRLLSVGCYDNNRVLLGVVPQDAPLGSLSNFVGVTSYQISKVNIVSQDFRTESFLIE